jgi:hypothetical protein
VPNKTTFAAGEAVRIVVTITNVGNAASTPAWADLYINPSTPPTTANVRWNDRCSLDPCFGLAWRLPAIPPGQSVTLTSDPGSYASEYSVWPGWFARGTTDLYAYADSWNPGVPIGAVPEANESNNRSELHGLIVTGTNPSVTGTAANIPARPAR